MPEGLSTGEPLPDDVSALLLAWTHSDQRALARITPIVYDELHRLAHYYLRREQAGHSLLNALAARAPRKAQVVELRFFGGLSVEETANPHFVDHHHARWKSAKAWLYRELAGPTRNGQ